MPILMQAFLLQLKSIRCRCQLRFKHVSTKPAKSKANRISICLAERQFVDVKIYSWLKKRCPKPNQLWIRNNGSTLFSQLLDSLTFCTIAFLGVYPMEVWWQILLTTYLIKFVVSAASTPVLYIARSMKVPEE